MIVSIKADKVRLIVPVPLFMGEFVIKLIPKEKMSLEQKEYAIKVFKAVRKAIKEYKGLKIVDVETSNGEKVVVKI